MMGNNRQGTMRPKKESAAARLYTRYPYWSVMFVTAIAAQACLMVAWNHLRGSVFAPEVKIANDVARNREAMRQRHLRSNVNAATAASVESSASTIGQQNANTEGGDAAKGSSSSSGKTTMNEISTASLPKPWPKPEGWKKYSQGEMHSHFKCGTYARDQKKAFPTLEEYQLFREKYKEHVNKDEVYDDDVLPTLGYDHNGSGGPPPYYAGYTADGKGRGLFASRDIKKGEFVHDGTYKDRSFPTGMSYRKFVFDLPRKNACDMLEWCWTQRLEKDNGKMQLLCTFNISILMNGSSSERNVMPASSTSERFFATEDIKKDEEILMDYHVYETRWDEVGLDSE